MAGKSATLAMLPWFPRDYLAATRGMTLAERGAYTDLLFFQWDTGPLPNDPGRLARMLGVPVAEFEAIWPALQGKFKIGERELWNERLERERTKSAELRRKASNKATQAAIARWRPDAPSNAHSNASSIGSEPKAMLGAMLEQCPPSPSPSPSSSPSKAHISGSEAGDSKEARMAKASTLMHASPDCPTAQVAKMYRLTEKEVMRLRPAA
jgi:uncharacterized protein YdaU (DUF1376 family)